MEKKSSLSKRGSVLTPLLLPGKSSFCVKQTPVITQFVKSLFCTAENTFPVLLPIPETLPVAHKACEWSQESYSL